MRHFFHGFLGIPFFHWGTPRNGAEITFRDPASERPIQQLKIPRWYGLSSGRRASWFIGFLRFKRKAP